MVDEKRNDDGRNTETLAVGERVHGCTIVSAEDLPEIDGRAIEMRHEISGARLLYLQNDDENKAFSIAFPTPPADDTGVFHILEHSVLCGSDKFPVKEPFVDLLKGSMQTFLNAMTFPDKTMYPVASTNEQDLLNLIDVYLDAVLNPRLYSEEEIFLQEGWHYELEGAEDGAIDADALPSASLKYNGVVFNEMKGALSDPEDVVYHAMNKALFPESCYAFESGGHPRAIPTLAYQDYCDTHARHYRLDNSYIVLYGDMNIDRVLAFLHTEYLSKPQRAVSTEPNPMGTIAPVRANDVQVSLDTAPENAMVALGYVVGPASDVERVMAADILVDALMGGNESPLKRAVLEAGLGGDCMGYLLDSQASPVVMFVLKNAQPGAAQKFRSLVEDEARKLAEGGIPRDVLEASLAQAAFSLREQNRGIADGVALAMSVLAGWLYDEAGATAYLRYEEPLAAMRKGLDGRLFEDLLSSLVVESTHCALVDLTVAEDANDEEDAELAEKAQRLSLAEREDIVRRTAALRARQDAPDTPEAMATLPRLHVSDIGPAKPDPEMKVLTNTPLPCLHHSVHARHINYVYTYFDLGSVSFNDLPYVALLTELLGELDTEKHTAAELDSFTRSHLGNLKFAAEVQVDHIDTNTLAVKLVCVASALAEDVAYLVDIPKEIWETTKFDDAARIRNRLVQRRIALEEGFTQAGHTFATQRASSYLFPSAVISEQLGGVDFYRFLCDVVDHYDERAEELAVKLTDIRNKVFVAQLDSSDAVASPLVSFTGTDEELDAFWAIAGDMGLPRVSAPVPSGMFTADTAKAGPVLRVPLPTVKNEAFIVPSEVCFTARVGNIADKIAYDGRWSVLRRVLSFDYLWNEVRTQGGAYGCGFRCTRQGHASFHSFRDPHIDATLQRFDAAGTWLEGFNPTTEEMEGYIVSTVAGHDAPAKPKQIAHRQASAYLINQPEDYRNQLRIEYLSATPQALRELAPVVSAVADSGAFCTFGNAETINAAQAPYQEIIALVG